MDKPLITIKRSTYNTIVRVADELLCMAIGAGICFMLFRGMIAEIITIYG